MSGGGKAPLPPPPSDAYARKSFHCLVVPPQTSRPRVRGKTKPYSGRITIAALAGRTRYFLLSAYHVPGKKVAGETSLPGQV